MYCNRDIAMTDAADCEEVENIFSNEEEDVLTPSGTGAAPVSLQETSESLPDLRSARRYRRGNREDFKDMKRIVVDKMADIEYKYSEAQIMADLMEYINQTYSGHYSQSKFQATEIIIDSGYGDGFCLGNIFKYAQRYGRKNGKNKDDLMKIIHYAIMCLYTNHYRSDN